MSNTTIEPRSIYRMLREMGDLAEHSSLTGSLSSGASQLAERYNRILELVTRQELVPTGMFSPVSTNQADYGSIGVESRMLAAYLSGSKERMREEDEYDYSEVMQLAPFLKSSDLGEMIREIITQGNRPPKKLLASVAPFLSQSDLGEFMRVVAKPFKPPVAPETPAAPTQPPAPSTNLTTVPEAKDDFSLTVASQEIAEMYQKETIQSLAQELQNPELGNDERAQIAAKILELSKG